MQVTRALKCVNSKWYKFPWLQMSEQVPNYFEKWCSSGKGGFYCNILQIGNWKLICENIVSYIVRSKGGRGEY